MFVGSWLCAVRGASELELPELAGEPRSSAPAFPLNCPRAAGGPGILFPPSLCHLREILLRAEPVCPLALWRAFLSLPPGRVLEEECLIPVAPQRTRWRGLASTVSTCLSLLGLLPQRMVNWVT